MAGQMASAGEADVLAVEASCNGGTTCRFSVTVQHADEGWDHYANRWEILGPDGKLIGVRELAHPHVSEQPFTRSLGNVNVPADISEVTVRAHDSVHRYGGMEKTVRLER
jgi:hypothetical protein